MLAQLYYIFPGIQKQKNILIILDMVEYILISTLNFGSHNNWIITIFK